MPIYFEYLLKAAVCLAIIYLFYFLLLRRLTCYTLNRYYLLFFSIGSFVIPFIDISPLLASQQQTSVSFVTLVPTVGLLHVKGGVTGIGFINYKLLVITVIYSVSFFLLCRFALQLLSFRKIKARARLTEPGDIKIYRLQEHAIPFSFFNNIFVNTDDYTPSELSEIIEHEKVHVQQQHTIDVILTEIICILNWYNPFSWLIKNAVRENLEYIADDMVIRQGADVRSYQYLLLKVAGEHPSQLANSIKFSSLKNRMVMMNKTKTSGSKLFRLILLIPVIGFIVLAFRGTSESPAGHVDTNGASTGNYILQSLTYAIADAKVQAIVNDQKHKSILQTGSVFKLEQIYDEKKRLLILLKKNGYHSLKSNAVMFWIDTASVRNRFLVEIKIDVEPAAVSSRIRRLGSLEKQWIADNKKLKMHPRSELFMLDRINQINRVPGGS